MENAAKGAALEAAAILAAVDEIVASPEFGRAARPGRFLRHLVETAQRGENHRLKESVLGVEVFGREASWDPRLDAIVRQEAARLRKRLARYYAGSGSDATIRIELPVGTYIPTFRSAPKTVVEEPVADSPRTGASQLSRRWFYSAAAIPICVGALLATWYLHDVRPRRVHVVKPATHDLVIEGRFDLQQATTPAVHRAEAEFQRAIDTDPAYAVAYLDLAKAKLAEASARGSTFRTELERDSAEELSTKALQIDPGLAEAHALLADLAMQYEWDWNKAEREFRSALAGAPSAKAEFSYAFFLIVHHRFAEADQHLSRAQEIDPFETSGMLELSQARYLESRFSEVREISQRLLTLHPTLPAAQAAVAGSHIWEGQPELALAALKRIDKPFPALPFYEAMARARAGRREEALGLIRPYEEKYPNSGVALEWIAKVYALTGDEADTVKWMERSADRREWQTLTIAVNPVFAPMENSAGFRALKRRMGLE